MHGRIVDVLVDAHLDRGRALRLGDDAGDGERQDHGEDGDDGVLDHSGAAWGSS